MSLSHEETVSLLVDATGGFDHLLANEMPQARETFAARDSPFHLMGLGISSFLEAALGMETELMGEATRCLTLAEAGAKKQIRLTKAAKPPGRFPPGLEWEVVYAGTIILNGMTSALSESYMGYLQCLYAMNNAHSKYSKLYKTVFPNGLDNLVTPATSLHPSRAPSTASLSSQNTDTGSSRPPSILSPGPISPISPVTPSGSRFSLLSRWGGSSSPVSTSRSSSATPTRPDGPVEELIESGVAFGYGLFNLIFSLLPARVRSVVGFFGFQHDRRLALQALAVSAAKNDVHSAFAGLALMTYHGVVLLLSGYQADEAHILKQYHAIVDKLESKYPTGSLWILNRAKILRMSNDAEGAIRVLQDGLKPDRPHLFKQADALLVFELAWTLLSQRRYQESADMFIRMTEINNWSTATYYFLAAGCYVALQNEAKAQELFDAIPKALEGRKIGGKDLPTEVFIKKKIAFYKKKQVALTGKEDGWIKAIKINVAEELAIFWNTHNRISSSVAEAHAREWLALTPPVTISSPYAAAGTAASADATPRPSSASPPMPGAGADLTTPDELALRALLLGIVHRSLGAYPASRAFLADAGARAPQAEVSTWLGGVTQFELAVLDLREQEALAAGAAGAGKEAGGKEGQEGQREQWAAVLRGAGEKLDRALALATNATDLSSRLDSRIAMLRDEIALKREMLGIAA